MDHPEPTSRITARCAALLSRAEQLSRQGMSWNSLLTSYASELISWDDQIAAGARSVRFILATIGGLEDEVDERFPGYLGRTRAELGVPSDELLRALNIDFEMCWAALTADEGELDRADLLILGSLVWRMIEQYSNAVLLAYQQREQELHRAKRLRTDATIAAFLARPEHRRGAVASALRAIGFDVDRQILTFTSPQAVQEIEQAIARRSTDGTLRVSALPEGTFGIWQSVKTLDGAEVLTEVSAIWDVPAAPEQAPASLRSLASAIRTLPEPHGTYRLEDTLMLQAAEWLATSQRYAVQAKLSRFDSMTPMGLARTTELVDALLTSSSLSEAARALHVHRNTLVQRVNQLQDRTGFNLRIPAEISELHLLLSASETARRGQPG